MNYTKMIVASMVGVAVAASGGMMLRFQRGRRRANITYAGQHYPKFGNWGAVERLSIMPLIDWYTRGDGLVGEPGVSYLIRVDGMTILFDLGFNEHKEHPSPLLRNMSSLGIDAADIDALFISHPHGDHLGGFQNQLRRTFSLSREPIPLTDIPVYTPVPLSQADAQVIVSDKPRVIAPGIALTGPIARQLFFLGWTLEHSLAINVAGKGVVLVMGCGHPTLQRVIERAEMIFDEPVYGIVGGLCYSVTQSRAVKFGVPVQRILGTAKWPWDLVNRDDVEETIAYLKRRNPGLVSISAHDSCDWSLDAFRSAFPDSYQDLLVGKEIVVEAKDN